MESTDIICSDKKMDFPEISLPHQIVARQIEEIGNLQKGTWRVKLLRGKPHALVIDESTDPVGLTQLAILVMVSV